MSAIASVLFLGGDLAPPGLSFVPEPLWMAAKVGGPSFFVIWLRTRTRGCARTSSSASRLAMIPVALALILVVGVVKVATA
jgi:NADH:ubiquinone oxidoreductase subunit H